MTHAIHSPIWREGKSPNNFISTFPAAAKVYFHKNLRDGRKADGRTCLHPLSSQRAEGRCGVVTQLWRFFALVSKFREKHFLKLNVHHPLLSYVHPACKERV